MQSLFETHKYLIEHLQVPVKRELASQIDWSHRLIGIKGARGVGKTEFLLDYAKSTFGLSKSCLYVNLNNLFFTERSIISFADEFRKKGGKTLILDQVYKYPDWCNELKHCYDNFLDLQIVFSGSSVMRLEDDDSEIKDCVSVYNLKGFSFREYLNLKTGNSFKAYSFEELIEKHEDICNEVVEKVKPLAYFTDYLHHGYYPYFLEKKNYLENVLKNINLTLEIDISYLEQIELKYLPKLRKLVYEIAKTAPLQPNVSRLSQDIETSRATVMNYINYLKSGRLIHLLYAENNCESMKRPSLVYMQNPNLLYSVLHGEVTSMNLYKTFFCNQVEYHNELNYTKEADFLVNNKHVFNIVVDGTTEVPEDPNQFYAHDMIEVGKKNQIPLWLMGFLY